MLDIDFLDLELFITGPTWLRPEIRQAATLPEFGHRDTENLKRFGPIFQHLSTLAGLTGSILSTNASNYEVILFNGSGSTAMEAAIRSLVAEEDTILHVTIGAFGDLWQNMSLANGKRAECLAFEPGQIIDPDRLDHTLAAVRPAVVACTHNETSTGVLNDLTAVAEVVHNYKALLLIDGVSLLGAAPVNIPALRPAMYIASTQKGLALPAGFGIAYVAPDALDKARYVQHRGFASDILAQLELARKYQTLTTLNTTLANQMAIQLDYIVHNEGLAARFARHTIMRDMVHAWVDTRPELSLFAEAEHGSPTITAVQTSIGMTEADLIWIKECMRSRGYLFDPGYAKLNARLSAQGRPFIFRIGHLGDITPTMLERYLSHLGEIMADLKI
ncbi:Aminotransferase class V [Desulfovibrionales bacterium]